VSAADKAEHITLEAQLEGDVRPKIQREVADLEALAKDLSPNFAPGSGNGVAQLTARAGRAMNAAFQQIVALPPGQRRNVAFGQLISATERLMGSDGVLLRLVQPQVAPLAAKRPTTQEALGARDRILAAERQIAELQKGPKNTATRTQIRDIARARLGLLAFAEVLQLQSATLDATESHAALDSELALLWWPDYPKARWQLNPLNWRAAGHVWMPGPVVMVTRLDAPTEQIVHDMIAASVAVEHIGLAGQIVLDGRGRTGADPYAQYDQTIRNCAEFLRAKSSAAVTFDDKEALIAPRSLKNIAVYCGWYSLRNYMPPGQFNAGAVGFHVASFELITLHQADEKGWVRGLLSDGVVATVGSVAEPYLQSFPPADEFFPLLLTGKLTLAEVYWRTTPWVSWMQTCIGDPLYRPYLTHPAVRVADLPAALRAAAGEPATRPATQPTSNNQ